MSFLVPPLERASGRVGHDPPSSAAGQGEQPPGLRRGREGGAGAGLGAVLELCVIPVHEPLGKRLFPRKDRLEEGKRASAETV